MHYITDQDYRTVIGEHALNVVSQIDGTIRQQAEEQAIEEISSYLRPKYDTDAIFNAQEEAPHPSGGAGGRSKLLVMYTCDIALYHMTASVPQKMGMEIRKERYERAIKWLEGVQAGKIVPDLPLATDEEGNPTGIPFIYGSQPQLKHNW